MTSDKEKREKQYKTEWSFSFEQIGDRINQAIGSVGEEVKTEQFSVDLEGATSARIVIGGSIGRTTISTLDNPNKLFEAEVAHMGEVEFSVTGDAEKVVTLRPKHDKEVFGSVRRVLGQIGKRVDLYMHIRINPNIPVRLELASGIGPSEFNLADLNLTGLDVDGGVGATTLTLPSTESAYNVKLDSGVGGVTINAPAATPVHLDVEGGVGATNINIPSDAALNIKLEAGVGGNQINVAPNVAVRLEAEGGLGGISVPKTLKRVKNDDDFITKNGVWETEGFALARNKVHITYEGGVGGFRLKQDEVRIV
jgi:hypothetical protein